MALLGETTLTRRRYEPDTWVEGERVAGASTDTPFMGSVQVLSGRERQVLPEGLRSRDGRKVYCDPGVLRAENQWAGEKADEVLIDGARFEVVKLEPDHPLIEHQKAWIVRVQEGAP